MRHENCHTGIFSHAGSRLAKCPTCGGPSEVAGGDCVECSGMTGVEAIALQATIVLESLPLVEEKPRPLEPGEKPCIDCGIRPRYYTYARCRKCRVARESLRRDGRVYIPEPKYPTPAGKCLMHRSGCRNDALPGDDLCAACDATYRPKCAGCGEQLRSDVGIERGYHDRCKWVARRRAREGAAA